MVNQESDEVSNKRQFSEYTGSSSESDDEGKSSHGVQNRSKRSLVEDETDSILSTSINLKKIKG